MTKERKLERHSGTPAHELVRKGTGGEHRAVVLSTAMGERLILQRIGGNPFDDETTRALVGREVVVEGFRVGNVLRYTKAEPS